VFLLYSPLNQGLKHIGNSPIASEAETFLLYSPLNQGLKQKDIFYSAILRFVFTLQSIKSRIETAREIQEKVKAGEFLLYSPLNQGLKHLVRSLDSARDALFLLYSPLNQGLKLSGKRINKQYCFCFYSTVH